MMDDKVPAWDSGKGLKVAVAIVAVVANAGALIVGLGHTHGPMSLGERAWAAAGLTAVLALVWLAIPPSRATWVLRGIATIFWAVWIVINTLRLLQP